MIKLAISGAHGRMGQAIIKLALQDDKTFQLSTLLEHKEHPNVSKNIEGVSISTNNNVLEGNDALIEFTFT